MLQIQLGNARGYRPSIPLKNYDVKLLKVREIPHLGPNSFMELCSPVPCVQPQNILGMLHAGTRDVGFAGADWVQELVRFCVS
jgi:ATP phosphoribosyltransferase